MPKRLSKKEQGFVADYIDSGNGTQAALKNYDTESENSAASIASQNLRKVKIQEAILGHAKPAESKIFHLSQKAKSEMVSFVASKDIMDRAGFKPVEKSAHINVNIEVPVSDRLKKIAQTLNES
jgi:phage terminase small subunit